MKTFLLTLSLLATTATAQAQPAWAQPSKWTEQVATNNTTLQALKQQTQAQILATGADTPLPSPEAEVSYMWGAPGELPGRTNVSMSQALDWGTLSGRRAKLAKATGGVAEGQLAEARRAVLAEAERAVVEVIAANRLCAELQERLRQAEAVQQLYDKKFAAGDANRMEVNKVRLNKSMAAAQLSRAEATRSASLATLSRLNGGKPLQIADTLYINNVLPSLPEVQQYATANSGTLRAAEAAMKQSEAAVKLNQTLALPEVSVGYTGEYIKGANYSGVSLGVSLPIWGGQRRRLKQSKAEATVAQLSHADASLQLSEGIAQEYATALTLEKAAKALKTDLGALNNSLHLKRALDEGQINVLDYILELSFYYEARTAWLEAEKEAEAAKAQVRGRCF